MYLVHQHQSQMLSTINLATNCLCICRATSTAEEKTSNFPFTSKTFVLYQQFPCEESHTNGCCRFMCQCLFLDYLILHFSNVHPLISDLKKPIYNHIFLMVVQIWLFYLVEGLDAVCIHWMDWDVYCIWKLGGKAASDHMDRCTLYKSCWKTVLGNNHGYSLSFVQPHTHSINLKKKLQNACTSKKY